MVRLQLQQLIWSYIEAGDGQLFHCILIVTLLHQVDRPKSSFTNQVDDLEPAYEFLWIISNVHKLAHSFEVQGDVVQTFDGKLLVHLSQQRNVHLEILVEVADIDERAENLRWEYQLEWLTVFLHRVQKSERPEAVKLDLMFGFDVFI